MPKYHRTLLIPAPALRFKRFRPYFPIGLYSIKEYAARTGKKVDVLDPVNLGDNQELNSAHEIGNAVLSLFNAGDYEIIGLSTLAQTLTISVYLAENIKRLNPNLIIVFGGPHASALATETLEDFPFVDAVVIGEGEVTFTEMLNFFQGKVSDWAGIPGVMIRNSPFVRRELLPDLDFLPLLNYNAKPYLTNGIDYLRVEAIRGCYAGCKFCAATQFWESKVRRKTPARLLMEMNRLSSSNNITTFQMIGDNFSFPIKSFREICQALIREKSSFKWACSLRSGVLTRQDLKLLHSAGCFYISTGVESASQDTLNRIGKKTNLSKIITMIQTALALGIQVSVSQIIGFPWETEKDVLMTLKQHSRLLAMGVTSSYLLKLAPLPGAAGFPTATLVTDFQKIQANLPEFCTDKYSLDLIARFPRQFIQFGYYETSFLRQSFIDAALDTAEQISGFKG